MINDKRPGGIREALELIEAERRGREIKRLRAELTGMRDAAQAAPEPVREALEGWVAQGHIDAGGDHCGAAAYAPALYVKSVAALASPSAAFPAGPLKEILTLVRAPNRPASERLDRIEEICTSALSSPPAALHAGLSEEERHAVEHARYQVEHATPDNPECGFDFDLVKDLICAIDRAYPMSSTDRSGA